MDIEIINDVVTEFTKRLQIPESRYDFIITSNTETVELIINVDDSVKCSLSIGNGSLKCLYNDEYNSDEYISIQFLTPITLLYYLLVFFYKTVLEVSELDFNELLSIILLENVVDWKTLVLALCENVNLSCEIFDNPHEEEYVEIEGMKLHFAGYVNRIVMNDIEINLKDHQYTTVVEAMFKCVEYVANIMDVADNLFNVEEEQDNLTEMIEETEGGPAGGGSMNIDMDMGDMPENDMGPEEPEPVEPMPNEDFAEPQGPVVEVEDLIE